MLVYANIGLYITMVISGVDPLTPEGMDLIHWGANSTIQTLQGEYWRLLSCVFVHSGFMHVGLNMFLLLYVGLWLEPYLGSFRFSLSYLLSGLGASTASLWWHDHVISVGASGAVFGVIGVFLALLTTRQVNRKVVKTQLISMGAFVLYNLYAGLAQPGIDNAAHIGGLLFGILIGYTWVPGLVRPRTLIKKSLTALLACLFGIGICIAIYKSMPSSNAQFARFMIHFSEEEQIGLGYNRIGRNATNYDQVKEIEEHGLPAWRNARAYVDSCYALPLSDDRQTQVALLQEYCDLRLRTYHLFLDEAKHVPNDSLEQLDELLERIEVLVAELSE